METASGDKPMDKIRILRILEVAARVLYGIFLIIPFTSAIATLPPTSLRHSIYLFFCLSYAIIIFLPLQIRCKESVSYLRAYKILVTLAMLSGFLVIGWWLSSLADINRDINRISEYLVLPIQGWYYYLSAFKAEGVGCFIIWLAPLLIFALSTSQCPKSTVIFSGDG